MVAHAAQLTRDITMGDTAQHVASLPDTFDCSALYDEALDGEAQAYCRDKQTLYGIAANLQVVHLHAGRVQQVEWQLPSTQAHVTAVLHGLRKDGYTYAHMTVMDDAVDHTLDVLASLPLLTTPSARDQLDQRMFTLANRGDFRTARTYYFVDRPTFSLATQQTVTETISWLHAGTAPWVTVVAHEDMLSVTMHFPVHQR